MTGALGGIGCEILSEFKINGYHVIGLDKAENSSGDFDHYVSCDLNKLCNDEYYRGQVFEELNKMVPELNVLINNAAIQILGSLKEITLNDWNTTLNVNLTAPMLFSQFFCDKLSEANGSIINIASIHYNLTKRRFVSYATSKSAIVGLTKSLCVDFDGKIRVNCISPAAIDTPMLRAGFANDINKVGALNKIHPSQQIGKAKEIAKLCILLASGELPFLNGANINIDGGINNVLKDVD